MDIVLPVVLDRQETEVLKQVARGRSLPARLVERARIVRRAASGMQDQQIASDLGITPEGITPEGITPEGITPEKAARPTLTCSGSMGF